jgi:inorganic phosphate transporter, PiT family
MEPTLLLVIGIIAVALIFDFLNGFHDAANAIATVVVSRTLTPGQAILLAGAANFIGYFGFGLAVAKTVGKGVVHLDQVTLPLILAALVGAIIWNIMTWWWGLPTSSSHALIGGLVGAGFASAGMKAVVIGGVLKIASFIIIAPLLGMIGASIFTVIIIWAFRKIKPRSANTVFRYMQLVSATWYAIGHGTNDAQKTMGIIAMTLVAGGITKNFHLAPWIVLSCYSAIALGTMFGGWRIVRTMGTQITKVRAMEGFCAESAASLVLMGTAHFGVPVSTTHVIAGSIMGVGAVEHAASVRWVTARKILWAWILTMPVTATFAALTFYLVKFLGM